MMEEDYLEPFESPNLLIESAIKRIDELALASLHFCEPSNYEFIVERDQKRQEDVHCLQLKRKIPGEIRITASGILNDLRHSLDQAVGDAAILRGRGDAKGIYFPIGKTEKDFSDAIANRCKRVDNRILDYLRSLQVHENGNLHLYALLSLAGPNKHQKIVGMIAGSNFAIDAFDSGLMVPPVSIQPKWIPSKNHVEFARVGQGGFIHKKIHVILEVCLGNGLPPLDGNAATVLRTAATNIRKIVSEIEAVARGGLE